MDYSTVREKLSRIEVIFKYLQHYHIKGNKDITDIKILREIKDLQGNLR